MHLGACALLVCFLISLATPVAAQSTTEDGIRALLRSDYPAAARILSALSNDPAQPDAVAQFFLAVLYRAGLGVKADDLRACGLFMKAAAREQPFSGQAAGLAEAMRAQFGAGAAFCVSDEGWQGGAPQILTLLAHGASAQTGTADGVVALARGDYQVAAEILRPIAEDLRRHDTTAQFFMAGLYETGRGVPADALRACALYQRAVGNSDQPFGREALFLYGRLTGRGEEFVNECQQLANIGFDNGFQPVTFFLGPSHAIEWTLAAATITHEGQTRRHDISFAQPGARFLPLRHTELATGSARSLARHFIEAFVWEPSQAAGEWTLRWHLVEVVRDQVIPIETVASVARIKAETPPSSDTFDVRQYTQLRVDDEGHATWAVLKGPNASAARIESDDERREVRDAESARRAALKRVDWDHRFDVHRQPEMAYVDADGCGDFQVFGWSSDRAESLVVRVDVSALGLSTQSATIDLSRETVDVSVTAHVFGRPQHEFYFCSDVKILDESNPSEIWEAVAGTMTIELQRPGIRARAPHQRRVTVTLNNVVLQNTLGKRVRISRPVRLTGIVGAIWG